LSSMFRDTSFNNGGSDGINNWNVSNCTAFGGVNAGMFFNCPFNQPIGNWDVGKGINFSGMFFGNPNFNQNISNWNVSFGTNFATMFFSATSFNQNIGGWDVSKATDINQMFRNATSFDQNIGAWDVSKVTNFTNFMFQKTAANYSAANLDAIYNGWSALTLVSGRTISFGTIKYTAAGQAGRDILTGAPNNWTITDGGT
jgi:surface protein